MIKIARKHKMISSCGPLLLPIHLPSVPQLLDRLTVPTLWFVKLTQIRILFCFTCSLQSVLYRFTASIKLNRYTFARGEPLPLNQPAVSHISTMVYNLWFGEVFAVAKTMGRGIC